MARRLLWLALLVAGSAAALVVIVNFLAYALLYHPHPYGTNFRQLLSTGAVELPFQTNAGRQSAFYFRPNGGSGLPARIWMLFGGNGSLALDWLPLVEKDQTPGNAFLLVDYPGYGKSEGRPGVASTRSAAEGALVALAARLGVKERELEPRLNLLGHSLGAAAALDFARSHEQVRRIILLAPFTSLREEAAYFITSPLSRVLKADYDNRAALRVLQQRRPPPRVLVFHGLDDELIRPAMGRALAAEFPSFVSFRGIPGADHDTVVLDAENEILALMAEDAKTRPNER